MWYRVKGSIRLASRRGRSNYDGVPIRVYQVVQAQDEEAAADEVRLARAEEFGRQFDSEWAVGPEVSELPEDQVMQRMGMPALFQL